MLSEVLTTMLILLILIWCWFQWKNWHLLQTARKLPTVLKNLPILGNFHYVLFGIECNVHVNVRKRPIPFNFGNSDPFKNEYIEACNCCWSTASTRTILQMVKEAAERGYNIFTFWIGPWPILVVNGAEDIQKVLTSSCTVEKGTEVRFAKYILGDGLVTAPYKTWKITRRHINPLFHPQNLEQLVPLFNRNCRELVFILSEHVGNGPVNVMEHAMDIGLKTICGLIFGADIYFDMKSKEFLRLKAVVEKFPFLAQDRFFKFWLRNDKLYNFLYRNELCEIDEVLKTFTKISRQAAELKKSKRKMNTFTEYEEDRKHFTQPTGEEPLCLLDAYRVLQENYPSFTEDDLQSEIATMYAAGTDTTALLTSSCLLALAHYTNIQERLYQEIMSVVGPDDDISTQDLLKLPYLDQVYKESLRWATVVPFLLRRTSTELSLSSCTIPAGCTLVLSLLGLNLNCKTFPNPRKFDPERFSPENVKTLEKNAFLPFSAGPRNCIGKKYADIFMKTMVIHILRKYKLTTNMDVNNLEKKYMVTLVSTKGYKISLENRE